MQPLATSQSRDTKKLLIFIVAYNASKTIGPVLDRIPKSIFTDSRFNTEILIIDDCSKDDTFHRGLEQKSLLSEYPITVLRNPANLGYGGNQKLGYQYAIDNNFDVVALLHGDGQYAPEELPRLVEPLLKNQADAVFGSRMMEGFQALKGGMPKYKFVGNKVLTFLQNRLAQTNLSEWHSGYRLYSVAALKQIPFQRNSNGFDFDTDIIIQLSAGGKRITELPIPTFYGDEICHVNGLQYAFKILNTCFLYRIQRLGIFYDPKFDLQSENTQYVSKFDFLSSHFLAINEITATDSCLIVGCGPVDLVDPFLSKTKSVSVVDLFVDDELRQKCVEAWEADLDQFSIPKTTEGRSYSKVLALDVIEHLKSPEDFLESIRASSSCTNAEIIITVPNIAFLPVRLMLLLGQFNYGKRGILDRTHTRLFTRHSLRRILTQSGYEIIELRGIPAPYPLAVGKNFVGATLLSINKFFCSFLPGMSSYQLFVRATPHPTVNKLLKDAISHSETQAMQSPELHAVGS